MDSLQERRNPRQGGESEHRLAIPTLSPGEKSEAQSATWRERGMVPFHRNMESRKRKSSPPANRNLGVPSEMRFNFLVGFECLPNPSE